MGISIVKIFVQLIMKFGTDGLQGLRKQSL